MKELLFFYVFFVTNILTFINSFTIVLLFIIVIFVEVITM